MPTVQVLPFSIDQDFAEAVLRFYLARKTYLPPDFVTMTFVRRAQYVPAYVFNFTWNVQWSAEFGNNRTEYHTTYHRSHHEHNKGQMEPHTTHRIVTDWRSGGGTDQGSAVLLAYAGNVLPPAGIAVVEAADAGRAISIDADRIDIDVEPYAVTSTEIWNQSVVTRASAAVSRSIRRWAQGDQQRNWHWSGPSSHTVSELLCPVEGFALTYKDQTFLFWMDGSDTTKIRHDDLPVDHKKVIQSWLLFVPGATVAISTAIFWDIVPYLLFNMGLVAALLGGAYFLKGMLESKFREQAAETVRRTRKPSSWSLDNFMAAGTSGFLLGTVLFFISLAVGPPSVKPSITNVPPQEVEDTVIRPLSWMTLSTKIPDPNGTVLVYDKVPAVFDLDLDTLLRKYNGSRYIYIQLTNRRSGQLKNIDVVPYTSSLHHEFLPTGLEGAELRDKLHAYYEWLGQLGTAGQTMLICRYEKTADRTTDYRAIFWYYEVHPLFIEPLQRKPELFNTIKAPRSTCPLTSKDVW